LDESVEEARDAAADAARRATGEKCAALNLNRSQIAFIEASRLSAISHLCMHFERVCGARLGKRWCSVYEEWLASAGTSLLPISDTSLAYLVRKLKKSGASEEDGRYLAQQMSAKAIDCAQRVDMAKTKAHSDVQIEVQVDNGIVTLAFGKVAVRINEEHFEKLRRMYELHSMISERDFHLATFAMVCRYDAAQGGQFRFAGGHHTALHGEVFDVLRDAFGVSCELFASPLNCRWPTYCSKHWDVDHAFGSLGDYSEFHPSSGAYEVNPPFEEELVLDMAAHLMTCLKRASSDSKPLTFVVITPHWPNRTCWEAMAKSEFCTRVDVVPVREHGYFEGAQHRKKSRYRMSSSDTSLIFLQTKSGANEVKVTDEKLRLILAAFRAKQNAKSK
jgi:phosphorylated CTD-interacting factor 1